MAETPYALPFLAGGVITSVVGVGVTWELAVAPAGEVLGARGWAEAECTVLSHEVEYHPGDDGDSWSNAIRYRFDTAEGPREGSRATLTGDRISGDRSAHDALLARFPPGATVPCRVDPADPSRSVLDASVAGALGLSGLLGPAILNLAAAMFGFGYLLLGEPEPPAGEGPVTLTCRESPAPELVFASLAVADTVGAALFLGVVGDDALEWAVAAVAFAAVPFAARSLRSRLRDALAPRLALALAPGTLSPGGTAEVVWSFGAGAERVASLRLRLEGRRFEPRGEDEPDREVVLADVEIVRAAGEDARAGTAVVAVPEVPPGVAVEGARVVWRLRSDAALRDGTPVANTWLVVVGSAEVRGSPA